jgi:hypothetical protein
MGARAAAAGMGAEAGGGAEVGGRLLNKPNNPVSEWLGPGAAKIESRAGEPIFQSADGLRKIRVDFKHPQPHNNPHMHVEECIGGKWVKSGPIYPSDVPHN